MHAIVLSEEEAERASKRAAKEIRKLPQQKQGEDSVDANKFHQMAFFKKRSH